MEIVEYEERSRKIELIMLYLRTNIEIQQFYERFEASLFAYCFSREDMAKNG